MTHTLNPQPQDVSRARSRALGDELSALRKDRGWTRLDLLHQAELDISPQTLATYEHGTRQCTVVRLWDLADVLDNPIDQLISRVMRRLGQWEASGVTIDLRTAAGPTLADLAPLQGWAKAQLATLPHNRVPVVTLSQAALDRLAQLCGLDTAELVHRLTHRT